MAARKTLYFLRRPVSDPAQSLLPSASADVSPGAYSLVLLEEAVESLPAFPGSIYVLPSASGIAATPVSGKIISYRDLVGLIAEHDSTIVL
ncbi:MAG: hypothetical protein H8K10_11240 [Nitrospira sp.]|nr:hypothetical protein [Nitrospira sp.]